MMGKPDTDTEERPAGAYKDGDEMKAPASGSISMALPSEVQTRSPCGGRSGSCRP